MVGVLLVRFYDIVYSAAKKPDGEPPDLVARWGEGEDLD
jgi:hypothetical protein